MSYPPLMEAMGGAPQLEGGGGATPQAPQAPTTMSPGMPQVPQINDQQLMMALLLQGLMQNNQQMAQSPDPQARAFANAAGIGMAGGNAFAQMPLIKQQLAQKQQESTLKQLQTLIKMQTGQADIGLKQAQTETEKGKAGRAERKLSIDEMKANLDAAFKKVEIDLKERGVLNQELRTALSEQRLRMQEGLAQKREHLIDLRTQEVGLRIASAAQKDPQLQQAINTVKLLPPNSPERATAFKQLVPLIEQRTGIKLSAEPGLIDKLEQWAYDMWDQSVGQMMGGPQMGGAPPSSVVPPSPQMPGAPTLGVQGPQQPPLDYGPAPGMGAPRLTPGTVKKTMQSRPTQSSEDQILQGVLGQ